VLHRDKEGAFQPQMQLGKPLFLGGSDVLGGEARFRTRRVTSGGSPCAASGADALRPRYEPEKRNVGLGHGNHSQSRGRSAFGGRGVEEFDDQAMARFFSMPRSSHGPFGCTTGTQGFRPSPEGPCFAIFAFRGCSLELINFSTNSPVTVSCATSKSARVTIISLRGRSASRAC